MKLKNDQAICKGCGRPITWGYSAAGKITPFDADGVSHFVTCPERERFRKKGKANGRKDPLPRG